MDPLSELDYSVSPYAYCRNNPVNLVDPWGLAPQDDDQYIDGGSLNEVVVKGKRKPKGEEDNGAGYYSVGGGPGWGSGIPGIDDRSPNRPLTWLEQQYLLFLESMKLMDSQNITMGLPPTEERVSSEDILKNLSDAVDVVATSISALEEYLKAVDTSKLKPLLPYLKYFGIATSAAAVMLTYNDYQNGAISLGRMLYEFGKIGLPYLGLKGLAATLVLDYGEKGIDAMTNFMMELNYFGEQYIQKVILNPGTWY